MNNNVFNKTLEILKSQKLNVIDKDVDRPWGSFFVIDEFDTQKFTDVYFKGLKTDELKSSGKLSPKILIILPFKRLSWQYHHRRSEIWKVTSGKIKVVTSHDDIERKEKMLKEGDEIRLFQGERHRIIGTDNCAVVAEIWIHTDNDNPSDENDIVRIQDDYGR